jgi:hypothetical protein
VASVLFVSRASVGTAAGVAFTTQPEITIQDANGNTVSSSSAVVTATVSSGGTLIGTKTATASSGIATFTNLGLRGYGGTAYTITYSVSGLTSATQSVTPAAYTVGNTGPGGGKIFYVAPSSAGFDCGPTLPLSEKCFYLESALGGWSGVAPDPTRAWAQASLQGVRVTNGVETATAVDIGNGYQNTLAIIRQGNNDSTTAAAALAQAYRGNGLSDWFLPSKNELVQLATQAAIIGGFSATNYWPSSEDTTPANNGAQATTFPGNTNQYNGKGNVNAVRPIRAF